MKTKKAKTATKPTPVPAAKPKWNGLCAAGHGLDYEGQPCDYCARLETAALLREKCPHGVATRIESCDVCDRTVRLTAADAASVEEALRGLRQVLELVKAPLLGLDPLPSNSPASEVVARGLAAEAVIRQALTPKP